MKTEGSVEIDRPIDEVFAYTTEKVVEWSSMVVEDEVIEEQAGMVGTTFRTVTEERGRRMEFFGEVLRHEVPTLHEVVMQGDAFTIHAEYSFEDLGNRTRVTQRCEVTGSLAVRMMFKVFGWMMRKKSCEALQVELTGLKRAAEVAGASGAL